MDEHVSRAIIQGLRLRNVDVRTTPEAGMLEASDDAQLERARIEGRVLFTQDADFLRLASQGKEHAGIVYAPQSRPVGEIIKGLKLIQEVLTAEEMIGKVEFL
jgi:predicted nuclease of predicted toxin-antitoxin system